MKNLLCFIALTYLSACAGTAYSHTGYGHASINLQPEVYLQSRSGLSIRVHGSTPVWSRLNVMADQHCSKYDRFAELRHSSFEIGSQTRIHYWCRPHAHNIRRPYIYRHRPRVVSHRPYFHKRPVVIHRSHHGHHAYKKPVRILRGKTKLTLSRPGHAHKHWKKKHKKDVTILRKGKYAPFERKSKFEKI